MGRDGSQARAGAAPPKAAKPAAPVMMCLRDIMLVFPPSFEGSLTAFRQFASQSLLASPGQQRRRAHKGHLTVEQAQVMLPAKKASLKRG